MQAERPQMKVVFCEQLGLDNQTWLIAKAETTRIFASAGVELSWLESTRWERQCDQTTMRGYPIVTLAPESPKGWTKPVAMALASPLTNRAYVFYNLVQLFISSFKPLESDEAMI